jgi:hypothetical protein
MMMILADVGINGEMLFNDFITALMVVILMAVLFGVFRWWTPR